MIIPTPDEEALIATLRELKVLRATQKRLKRDHHRERDLVEAERLHGELPRVGRQIDGLVKQMQQMCRGLQQPDVVAPRAVRMKAKANR